MNAPLPPERSAKVRSLFEELSELPADGRSAFLDKACRDDPDLRRELTSLLQQADSGHPHFDQFARRVVQPMLTALRNDPSGLNVLLDELSSSVSAEGHSMVGTTVSHFDILAPIGRGGMGVVYQARDRDLDRTVALKFLPPALCADDTTKSRFIQEARAASALDHPNIATVYEIGETADQQLFIAMGYYEGETLKQKLDRGPLPAADALAIGTQLAAALARAHSQGVTHRDVKPGNVMITKDGTVKLLDFGLAKLANSAGHTQVGEMIGTAAYMSPEQARGESVDARTDVWSLGVVLCEMFTGQRPFRGENAQAVIFSILNRDPLDSTGGNSVRDADVSQVIARCLAKDPAQRYQSAGEVLADLRSIGTRSPWSKLRREFRWATRERRTRRAIAAGLALVVIGSLGAWFLNTFDVVGTARIDSLAVLPFNDLAGNPEQEYFAEGMQEALIAELAKISGLRVISRQSTVRYGDSELGIPEIAGELNVDGIVTVSLFRDDETVHLRVQLVEARPVERPRWTRAFVDNVSNVLTMHNEVAREIAREIHVNLTSADKARLAQNRIVTPASYEAYLKGMHFLNKSTPEDAMRGMEFFQEAVEKNPADPFAYVGLSHGYLAVSHGPGSDPDPLSKARAALERALRLDPTLAEAHVALADLKLYRDWDLPGFEAATARALELSPNSATMHYNLAWYHVLRGDFEDAVREHHRAQELDPLTPLNTVWIPAIYTIFERDEEALAIAAEISPRFPDHPVILFTEGMSAGQLGRFDFAVERHEKLVEANPGWAWALGCTYALAGRTDEARRVLGEWESHPADPWNAFGRAAIHAQLGDADEAFRWIEHRPAHSWIPWVARLPMFDPLRDDPRLTEFLERHRLPLVFRR